MNEQFKEGQYIRNIKTNEIGEVQYYGEESNYPFGCYFVYSFGNEIFDVRDCELWEPKQGEYICYQNGKNAFQVAQVISFQEIKGRKVKVPDSGTIYYMKDKKEVILSNETCIDVLNIKPFIGKVIEFNSEWEEE
jgi:hypothetical protein